MLNDSLNNKSEIAYVDYYYNLVGNITSATAFNIGIAKSGYVPISYSTACGYSTSSNLVWGVEAFDKSIIKGYYVNKNNFNIPLKIRVAYIKI